MSVSLRVTGAWAELVADGSVAIPATPQAGDRMYLFARWKDFSVTATVANWTELVEFADGAVGTGNGTGSVKVGCWYRDWQPGDTDPAIDFSAAPENASVVIMVMAKGPDDIWLTPVAVTAAMTNWTTTSQIVAASSTAIVKSDGVVIGLIGIRDDTATMTRPTTGIDDSAAAVTWNGNYVESPATHHSTTTGDDGAADLGYRLVSVGATATLRMTGTISAAETGAALWVVQGISVVVTPGVATLTSTRFAPSLRITAIPSTATLSLTSFGSQLHERLTPAAATLSLTTLAPVLNESSVPVTASLTLGSFAPTLHEQVTPSVVNLALTSFAPAPTILVTVVPTSAGLIITSFDALLHESVIVPTLTLTLTGFIPVTQPPQIVFLDPGGDAVQAVGYFNTLLAGSTGVSFDTAQKVVGVGSYKFDSLTGDEGQQGVSVTGVLSHDPGELSPRRFSCQFRYDSVPDAVETLPKFPTADANYSGDGFAEYGPQSETTVLLDTITGSGNATFTITSALIVGSPLDISVAVLVDDTADVVASKAATAINANTAVSQHFTATADGLELILTVVLPTVVDETLNIAYANDTCTGLTPSATSEDTTVITDGLNGALAADDGAYGQARPAKNDGQGAVFGLFGFDLGIPIGAAIDSVTAFYERKYDVDTSIGISRVKYRIDGIEGPDYDNADMPLTDTVVTVEFTDRGFTRDELTDARFEIIVEARRGDSDTEHTQSWDYVKVEVVWHLDGIIQALDSTNTNGFKIGLSRNGTGARLRFSDNDGDSYLGITQLAIDTWYRISFAYIQIGTNDFLINIYVNGILELSLSEVNATATPMFNFRYGWLDNPGAAHHCWFDQLYIDDGDDLSDTVFGAEFCPPHSTAKLPATVNENNWNTTVGTGAVNERPLSITNHMKETRNLLLRQTYTLEADDEGDVDISGESLLGYMGWAWASLSSSTYDNIGLVVNDTEIDRTGASQQGTDGVEPMLFKAPFTSVVYPSEVAGIGMISNEFSADTLIYECGVVQAYQGPAEESILPYQLLAEDTVLDLVDDLRADPPESYEFCYRSSESETAIAMITVSSLDQEGGSIQHQLTLGVNGGSGQTRIPAGIEVQVHIEVTGGSLSLGLWHRVDFD